jgi:protein SCO1/2
MRSHALERTLAAMLVLFLAAIGVVLVSRTGSHGTAAQASAFAGPTFPVGLRAANFSLADQDGHRVSLSRERGRVVILTFIHSRCQDACPFMVEQIKGALNDLPGGGRGTAAIGISVNPGQDTRTSRRAFLARHEMTGRLAFLNGAPHVLRTIWHAYAMQPDQGTTPHTAFVVLIDKRGVERVGFPADQLTPEGLAHDIARLEREPV